MFSPASVHDYVNHVIVLVQLCFCTGGLLGVVLLRIFGAPHDRSRGILAYGTCLFLCGLCSYLYTTRFPGIPVPWLRRFDHTAIFLFIAGTYSAFATRDITGPFRIRLLHWVWGMAILGITLRLLIETKHDQVFTFFYVVMGWTFLTAAHELIQRLPRSALKLLGFGAVVYSVGAVIFALNLSAWTDPVWHGCVFIGAVSHFVAILKLRTHPMALRNPNGTTAQRVW